MIGKTIQNAVIILGVKPGLLKRGRDGKQRDLIFKENAVPVRISAYLLP